MNYSRRQLEALGEPLGDCVTRKEGGRIIYGGGGSSAPSTQTQVSDLPDWAKPYAQETLEKTKALTAGPYQTYGAPRIAGFSPLQEQAQAAAGQMGPSQLGQFGGQVAGAASLGALGTQYNPFRMGQFTAGRAAQYMNPFVEMAMEPQLREAQRSSEMQRMADQAQAVRSGAFGGGRQAIVEAERQRNLGTQMGDIRAKGYMSAFDQAQQQFAREQQLREQSRQFGAGLGMQGFQTALQGAGQLGALGGQEFGQQRETIGLQSQLGAQQQALRQQGLTQAYQDFLNEQNYPYKQLGFMSDMIRGLPLGQQSTKQIYEPPGSIMGQIGGIGTGLLGLSAANKQFGSFFAEGGQVDEYADGGSVTSNYFVDNTLDKLSDVQLEQSKLAALNRGDRQQVAMIDDVIAERASLRAGLGNAFDSLPAEDQERVFTAASGGIVAFANGGVSPEFGGSDFVAPTIKESSLLQRLLDAPGRAARGGKSIAEYYGGAASRLAEPPPRPPTRPFVQPLEEEEAAAASRVSKKPRSDAKPAQARGRAPATGAANASISQAATQLAEKAGVDKETFLDKFKELRDELNKSSKEEMKSLLAEAEKSMGGSKEVKERALGEALANFGFKWAAAAAKPGAKFLGSAAEAGPTLASSMAENPNLAREMDQNHMTMRMSLKQFEIAQRKGDMQTAATLAGQVRALEQSQATLALQREQLAEQRRSSQVKEGLMRQRIAAAGPAAQAKSSAAIMKNYGAARERALDRAQRLAKADFESAALNPAMQKMFKDRGITSSAQLYELYAERELGKLNKGFISNVTPDDSDDDE